MNRPLLIPGLPRIWRGPRGIQLGADPSRAVSVELPDPRAARVLDLLDGTRSERAVLLRAAELGVSPDHARCLLDTLHAAGLVLPAAALLPTALPHESRRRLVGEASALALAGTHPAGTHPADILRRRAACRVLLTGHGRLGAPTSATRHPIPAAAAPGSSASAPGRTHQRHSPPHPGCRCAGQRGQESLLTLGRAARPESLPAFNGLSGANRDVRRRPGRMAGRSSVTMIG